MGWKLFLHSVRMVLDNLGTALRVSGLLYLGQFALQLFVFTAPAGVEQTAIGAGETLVMAIIATFCSLWIAIGWHRFVLTGEAPAGFVPRWHGAAMASYLGRSLAIGMIIGLGVGLLGGVLLGLAQAVPQVAGFIVFGLVGLASYAFFRLGLVLPAAALGRSLSLRESWEATKPDSGALLVLALIVMGGRLAIEIPVMIDGDSTGPISLVYTVVVNWFATMFGVSLLTTLYGHFIEKRRID